MVAAGDQPVWAMASDRARARPLRAGQRSHLPDVAIGGDDAHQLRSRLHRDIGAPDCAAGQRLWVPTIGRGVMQPLHQAMRGDVLDRRRIVRPFAKIGKASCPGPACPYRPAPPAASAPRAASFWQGVCNRPTFWRSGQRAVPASVPPRSCGRSAPDPAGFRRRPGKSRCSDRQIKDQAHRKEWNVGGGRAIVYALFRNRPAIRPLFATPWTKFRHLRQIAR